MHNYTCIYAFDGMFDLEKIAASDPRRIKYIPRKFRGAHVKTGVGTTVHTRWDTGRLPLLGARTELDAIESMNDNIAFYQRFVVPFVDKTRHKAPAFTLDLDEMAGFLDIEEFIDEITL